VQQPFVQHGWVGGPHPPDVGRLAVLTGLSNEDAADPLPASRQQPGRLGNLVQYHGSEFQ